MLLFCCIAATACCLYRNAVPRPRTGKLVVSLSTSAPPVHDLFAATQGPAAPPAPPPPPPVAPAPFQLPPAAPAPPPPAPAPAAPAPTTIPGVKYYDREVFMAGKWCPPLAQNQQHAEPRPGERVVLWCLYDPDANEAKPWRVQWKEGGERMGTRKGRDDVRVKA